MGDRVLMQVVTKNEFGPMVYCHWSGSTTPETVRALAERMKLRKGDVEYASARLVQIAAGGDDGALSFGVSNADRVLGAEDSHGDAGVVVIHCDENFRCDCSGGYLITGPDGFPMIP